jgi:hypothetical protein
MSNWSPPPLLPLPPPSLPNFPLQLIVDCCLVPPAESMILSAHAESIILSACAESLILSAGGAESVILSAGCAESMILSVPPWTLIAQLKRLEGLRLGLHQLLLLLFPLQVLVDCCFFATVAVAAATVAVAFVVTRCHYQRLFLSSHCTALSLLAQAGCCVASCCVALLSSCHAALSSYRHPLTALPSCCLISPAGCCIASCRTALLLFSHSAALSPSYAGWLLHCLLSRHPLVLSAL